MFGFIGIDANKEIVIVYSLIGLIIILILAVLLIDYISKNKNKNTLDSKTVLKNLKRIQKNNISYLEEESDDRLQDTIRIETTPILEKYQATSNDYEEDNEYNEEEIETLEEEDDFSLQTTFTLNDEISEENIEEEKDGYYQEKLDLDIEDELEKTQAQIEVEEITKALEKAIIEEERIDPYQQFEEEQEENAIISYDELVKNYDRLYDENEKRQYLNDDNLPINMNELYEKNDEIYHTKKIKLDDINTIKSEPVIERPTVKPVIAKPQETSSSKFKNSPLISPVYGIQREKPKPASKKDVDEELQKTQDFLNTLRELQKNLNN